MKTFIVPFLVLAACGLAIVSCKKSSESAGDSNTAPTVPSNPSPANAAVDVSVTPILSWVCSDPDPGDTLSYDICLDTVNPPVMVIESGYGHSKYPAGQLQVNKTYYWMVRARDSHGASTIGPVWKFTTLTSFPVNDLVAYYPFNGNAHDESGNGHDGTPRNGVALTTDQLGNGSSAYYFDGVDDYIELGTSSGIDLGSNFSLTAHVFTEAPANPTDGIFYTIIAKRDEVQSGNANLFPWDVGIDFSQSENFSQLFLTRTGSLGHSASIVHGGYWDFVAVTVSHDTATFWINANKSGTFLLSSPNLTTSQPMLIGWDRLGGRQFKGKIDEVRIYSRALSETEIMELAQGGGPK